MSKNIFLTIINIFCLNLCLIFTFSFFNEWLSCRSSKNLNSLWNWGLLIILLSTLNLLISVRSLSNMNRLLRSFNWQKFFKLRIHFRILVVFNEISIFFLQRLSYTICIWKRLFWVVGNSRDLIVSFDYFIRYCKFGYINILNFYSFIITWVFVIIKSFVYDFILLLIIRSI